MKLADTTSVSVIAAPAKGSAAGLKRNDQVFL
jgi:hypothetical protein